MRKLDKDRLVAILQEAAESLTLPAGIAYREGVEDLAEQTMVLITRASDAAMPWKKVKPRRHPAYWWTQDIAKLRWECVKARQLASHTQNRLDVAAKNPVFKGAQKHLSKAIKRSKVRCWVELCRSVVMDPWGMGYNIMTRKLA